MTRDVADGDVPSSDRGLVLARNLRRVRKARDIRLSALARDSGVARATLYQMEAGGGNPTIDTLWAVCNSLKVPLSELVAEDEPPHVQVIRADSEASVVDVRVGTRLIRRFSSSGGLLELYHMRIDPGQATEGHAHPRGVYEHVLVTQGRLATGPDDQTTEIGPGDYISFRGDVAHRYRAVSDEVVIATLVMEYPPAMNLHGEHNIR